jgi:Rrf2 family protein
MIYFTKKIDYGLELMIELAQHFPGRPLSLKKIAHERRLSLKFIEQIAAVLRKRGLIGAREGRVGGYFLTKSPGKISLWQIIKALDGDVLPCDDCLKSDCYPKGIWREFERIFIEKSKKLTLKEICLLKKGGEKNDEYASTKTI